MKKNVFRRVLYIVLGVAIMLMIIKFGFIVFNTFVNAQKELSETIIKKELSYRDSNLLTKEYLKELTKVQTCYFKNNEEFAIAETKGGDVLFICKLKISNDLPLKNGVDFNLINSKISTGYIYTDVINNNLYKFQYLINSNQKNHNLLLTANSNTSNSYVSSDSFVGYNFLAKDFSLKYGINEPVIINISKKNDLLGLTKPISMSILINKRKDGIYFLALIVNEKNKPIANNLLLGIINKE